MSLQTDLIFLRALQQSSEIAEVVADRIYDTAIPRPEKSAENEPIPYIIVTFDGIQPTEQTKDDDYDSDYDTVQVGITLVARKRPSLAELSDLVRRTVRDYFKMLAEADPYELDEADAEVLPLLPTSCQVSGGMVEYEDEKPCYFMTMQYSCETTAFIDDDES